MAIARKSDRWFPGDSFYTDEKCHRCGVCCGSTDGDPCEHLKWEDGGYVCETYEARFGSHHTVNGYPIHCVSIRKVIEQTGGYDGCDYVEEIKRIRTEGGEPIDDLGRKSVPGVF